MPNICPPTHGYCFSWQLSLTQAELQSQWEAKCEHLLASAKDEHLQQYQEVCAQRDAHQQKLSRLQDEVVLSLGRLTPVHQAVLAARKHSQACVSCS